MLSTFFKHEVSDRWLLLFFSVACIHLATQIPHISIIIGERTKIFSSLVCGAVLLSLLIIKRDRLSLTTPWIICMVLSALCILSGFGSTTPSSSLWRGFSLISSGLGGFWCGRWLLAERFSRQLFGRLCLLLLSYLLVMSFVGYILHDDVRVMTGMHKHVLNGLILLLSYGPMQLLFEEKKSSVILGACYLVLSTMVISLSFDPMIWFPPLLLFLGLWFQFRMRRRVLLILFAAAVLLTGLFQTYKLPDYFFKKESISIWVRVENVFFSYHIAQKNPLLGIGLVAPRSEYLEDYTIVYPYLEKETFAAVIPEENRSSENQFFTFLCDLGFPFTIIYSCSVILLYLRLSKFVVRGQQCDSYMPLALWIPLTGGLLHLQVFDGLLHPHTSWFLHLLLGMVPEIEE